MDSFGNLQNRGFVKQCSNEQQLRGLLAEKSVVFYIGFDPTADSLHVGSLVPIMAMAHLQRDGHTPICVIGGATTLIGDPSGKAEMRRMMSAEEIDANGQRILAQLKRYLYLDSGKGRLVNNADWCSGLKYIDFLREVGRYFKVNEMLRAESYKMRLERKEGLSFIEFNYQLLQAYDFLVLKDRHNCILQMGGDDQWGNIVAGIGLVRQMRREEVYAVTFPLLETAGGKKMGKTESGTVWLDPAVHRQSKRFPKHDRQRIEETVGSLRENPYQGDLEKLEGEAHAWRRRVGAYRIFFELHEATSLIHVYRVERRGSHTY